MRFERVVKIRRGGAGYRLTVDNLIVSSGERLALIGDSGSGKSTILDMMALVLKPDEADDFSFKPMGSDKWQDLWKTWQSKRLTRFEAIRRSSLGYVMQTGGLLPFLTVRDNISLPAELKGTIPTKIWREKLKYLAEELKITHLLTKYPTKVSVGERQRCAIARALVHNPSLVLADEPTASLDPPTAERVFELLLRLSQDCALVVSTHEHRRVVGTDFKVYRLLCRSTSPDQPIEAMVIPPEEYRFSDEGKVETISLEKKKTSELH
jgi:putative ABC transport system ATP-binding protein